MYYRMLVLFDKSLANTSIEARRYVIQKGHSSELQDIIGFQCYDSFCIGAEFSGTLTTKLLNQKKLLDFAAEVKKQYGWAVGRSILDTNQEIAEKKKEQAADIFFKNFPDFKGELPFFRDDTRLYGYEDDACLVENERQFYKWVGEAEGFTQYGNRFNGISCIDINNTIISPENIIAKKWIVVSSCHYASDDDD